jgi:hypothetical protein
MPESNKAERSILVELFIKGRAMLFHTKNLSSDGG